MKIIIETIPHSEQRYDTCGDWQWEFGPNAPEIRFEPYEPILRVKVSDVRPSNNDCSNDYNFLIGIHEAIEAWLCSAAKVSEERVDKWDKEFRGCGEPGDDPLSPYHRQHRIATLIEMLLATELGVNWHEYTGTLAQLKWEKPQTVGPPWWWTQSKHCSLCGCKEGTAHDLKKHGIGDAKT